MERSTRLTGAGTLPDASVLTNAFLFWDDHSRVANKTAAATIKRSAVAAQATWSARRLLG